MATVENHIGLRPIEFQNIGVTGAREHAIDASALFSIPRMREDAGFQNGNFSDPQNFGNSKGSEMLAFFPIPGVGSDNDVTQGPASQGQMNFVDGAWRFTYNWILPPAFGAIGVTTAWNSFGEAAGVIGDSIGDTWHHYVTGTTSKESYDTLMATNWEHMGAEFYYGVGGTALAVASAVFFWRKQIGRMLWNRVSRKRR